MPFLRTAVERRWALSGLLNERAGEFNPIGMKKKSSIYHQDIAAALALKYKRAESAASPGDHRYWLELYYDAGKAILEFESRVRRLDRHLRLFSRALQKKFPDVKKQRFSLINLKGMRSFYLAYSDYPDPAVWEAIYQLSWQHHRYLWKIDVPDERLFYLRYAATYCWSCRILFEEIKKDHYGRIGMPSNFSNTLSSERCQLAQLIFKKAYIFAFINGNVFTEKELERAFIDNIQDFLRELGPDFTFKGCQQQMKIGSKKYIYDLVLYHTVLKCHIVIDIKRGKFKPEYISKMDSYLSGANKKLKGENDNDAIGIILCMSIDDQDVADVLSSSPRPIGIAVWCTES